jgi:hypothetical protein
MKKILLAVITLALSHATWGQLVTFSTFMNGAQEVPPVSTPATGTGTATFNPSTNFFTLTYAFSGLVAPQIDAHIHVAPPGVPGPIVIPLPLGSPVNFSTTITEAQEAQLLSNLWYVNIHSAAFPNGEIRGQLVAVPEPGTYAVMGAAVLAAAVILRRRRKV